MPAEGLRFTQQEIDSLAREKRALQLRAMKYSYAEIAADIGMSTEGTRKLITNAFARLKEEVHEQVVFLRQQRLQELNEVIGVLKPRALQGDIASAKALLATYERESRLLGMDAPNETKIIPPSPYDEMSTEDLLEEARRRGIPTEQPKVAVLGFTPKEEGK